MGSSRVSILVFDQKADLGKPITTPVVIGFLVLSDGSEKKTKDGSRFWVLNYPKWEKEKIFWMRDMTERTGEERGVPASYSKRPGF